MRLMKYVKKAVSGFMIFVLALFTALPAVSASEPKVITAVYDDFDDLSQFTLNNSTLWNNPNKTGVLSNGKRVLRLTSATEGQSGSAFFTKRVSLVNQSSFSAHFSFQITNSGGYWGIQGADGLSFIVQTVDNNVGSSGGGIGYQGISPSIAVEFDTWRNDEAYAQDPSDNHVGINVNGNMKSVATANLPGSLKSGTWYAWVNYNGEMEKMEVRVSQNSKARPTNPIVSYDVNLQSVLNQDEVFIGFTSSTGGGWSNHDITSFYFDNDNTVIDTEIETYEPAPTKVTATAFPQLTNQSSVVSVQVKNENDTPAVNKTVTFTSTLGTIQATATTDEHGFAEAVVSSDVSGTANIKAVAVGGAYAETSVTFDVDAPISSLTLTPVNPGTSGWYTTDTIVTLTAADNMVGVQKTEYRLNDGQWETYTAPFTVTEGNNTIKLRSVDSLGNVEQEQSSIIKVDHTAPTTSIEETTQNGSNGWYISDQYLELFAQDNLSGVAKTEYRLNGGQWVAYTDFIVLSEGIHQLEYRSVDLAGNIEDVQSKTIKVDTTAPAFSISATPTELWAPNHSMVSVTVTVEASDDTSQIASIILDSIKINEEGNEKGDGNTSEDIAGAEYGTYDTTFELRAERSGKGNGRVYTITYAVTDIAGNKTTQRVTVVVKHDNSKK